MSRLLYALGRILLPAVFIVAGWNKLLDIKGVIAQLEPKNLPIPFETDQYIGMPKLEALAYLVAAVELFGGVMILIGWKARWAALVLFVFSGLTIYYFHDFWTMEGADRLLNQTMALKNLSIMGGLLMVMAIGSGPVALDRSRPV
jgi:putative oxidoreductase